MKWGTTVGQGFFENVLHCGSLDATVDQALADALLLAWSDAFTSTDWHLAISDDVSLAQLSVKDISIEDGAEFITVGVTNGSSSADNLPAQTAAVISVHSTHGGRRGRGRIYTAGYTEAQNTPAGGLEGSVVTAVLEGWNTMFASWTDLQVAMGVFSRADDEVYPLASITMDGTWDTQRRRVS